MKMWLVAFASFALSIPSLHGQDPGKPDEKKPWVVASPPGPSRDVTIDVDEGTWLNLDVSPDGLEIVFDLLGDLYTLPIGGGDAKAIQSGVAWDMQPRFSRDGTRIVFTSDRGGGDNVWICDRDGANPKQVTKESFRLLSSPAFSPDGEWVVARKHFSSRRSLGTGEIFLYHVSGGEGLQLTTRPNDQKDVNEPVFSPDGRYVYFSYDSTSGSTFEYNKDSNDQIYAIDRLDRTTGDRVALVTGPGGACRPTPSHDGKRLAFVRRVRYQTCLFVMDLASGRSEIVYDKLERDMQEAWAIHGVYPGFAWAPDDKSLIFWAAGKIRRFDLETRTEQVLPFRVRGSRAVQESVRFPVAVAPDAFEVKALRHVAVSPKGDQVVSCALGRLWVKDLPLGVPRRLTTGSGHFEFFPEYSRDGSSIVYVSFDDEELSAIRVVPSSGGEGRRITSEPGHYLDPVFSPDGQEIVFQKGTGGYLVSPLWSRDPGIYRIPSAGGTPRLVSKKGTKPQFGARSDRVYVTTEEPDKDSEHAALLAVDLDGSDQRTLFTSDWATEFAVSPDERWIAFSERFHVYVAPLLSTGREVALGPKLSTFPIARVSKGAGENLQFSGDGKTVHWSLGPELSSRELAELPIKEGEPTVRNISFQAKTAKPSGDLALVGARLITMRDDEVIEDGVVVVRENRILAVGPRTEVQVPEGARVVDVKGATILPGILDVHAHGSQGTNDLTPETNWINCANVAFGVTTIHDPSNDTNAIFAASELAKAGDVLAPRIFSTGTILYGATGNFKAEVESLEDARSHLARLKAVGAFSVKSYNQPRRDQRQQIIEAARELGMMVVPEGGSLFQHNMTMIVDGHTGIEHTLPVERIYRDVQALWAGSKTGYTPTLIVGYGGLDAEHYFYQHMETWKHERLMTFVPRFVVDPRGRRREMAPEEDYNVLRSASIVKSVLDAGGQAQLGAHGQLAGLGAHWELWAMARGGITNHQALRCATLYGARYLGLDGDLGSLEPGKLADLLVLEKNPLEDIRNSESLRYTMLNGRLLDSRTLKPADGSPGEAPRFFFSSMQDGMPSQTTTTGCAGCRGRH